MARVVVTKRARWIAVAALALVGLLVVLGITHAHAEYALAPAVGKQWRVIEINSARGLHEIPSGKSATLHIGDRDIRITGAEIATAKYRPTHPGFVAHDVTADASGYAGSDPTILEVRSALAAILAGGEVRVETNRSVLALRAGDYVITCTLAS